jgi:hypothetical protein
MSASETVRDASDESQSADDGMILPTMVSWNPAPSLEAAAPASEDSMVYPTMVSWNPAPSLSSADS